MSSIIDVSVLDKKDKREINRSIELFLDSLGREWETEKEKISKFIQDEFRSSESIILRARIFEKHTGYICIIPFNILGFSDDSEKQKLIKFFYERKINQQEVAHIGGLGLVPGNSKVDLMQWSEILIFAAIKAAQHQHWKYVIGQTKRDGYMERIAPYFGFKKIDIEFMNEEIQKSWFLKIS